MNILYWVERFLPHIGGIETFSQQLIPALQGRGHSFTIITSGRSFNDSEPNMTPYGPVWHFPFVAALIQRNLHLILSINSQITQILQIVKPDLIHLNSTLSGSFFYLRNQAALRIPTVLTLHVPLIVANKPSSVVSQVINSVTHLVAVSRATLRDANRIAPGMKKRTTLIYNALDDSPLSSSPLSFKPPVLICLGRLSHQKGFDIAIDAFYRVLLHYPTATLRIVGDGELRPDL